MLKKLIRQISILLPWQSNGWHPYLMASKNPRWHITIIRCSVICCLYSARGVFAVLMNSAWNKGYWK